MCEVGDGVLANSPTMPMNALVTSENPRELHGFGVGKGQRQSRTDPARRADRAKQICAVVSLIDGPAEPRAAPCPLRHLHNLGGNSLLLARFMPRMRACTRSLSPIESAERMQRFDAVDAKPETWITASRADLDPIINLDPLFCAKDKESGEGLRWYVNCHDHCIACWAAVRFCFGTYAKIRRGINIDLRI